MDKPLRIHQPPARASPITHSPTCPWPAAPIFFISENLLPFTPFLGLKSVSSQMLQIFLSPHHSVSVALPLTSLPIYFPISISAGTVSLRLPSSLSFIDHLHTLSPSFLPEYYFLNANLVLLYPWSVRFRQCFSFAYRGKISKPNMYILMDL